MGRFFARASLHSVHVHLPWPARDTRPKRAALVTTQFVSDVSAALRDGGELHIVFDNESVAEETCGTLTRSRIFAPCLNFPFHVEGLPTSYPAGELLPADVAEAKGGRKTSTSANTSNKESKHLGSSLFYTRWEKRPPRLPNFRFQGA